MEEKTMCIVVDDGRVRVPIENKSGDEVGAFYFMPTDIGIVARYNEIMDKLDAILAPLDAIGEESTQDEWLKAMQAAEANLRESLDYLFGGDAYDAFFGRISPFSPINGVFYCENALEAVGRFISQQYDTEAKRIEKRVKQYTGQYENRRGAKKL